MKTQLLEDIGQSTTAPLAPPRKVATPTATEQVRPVAPASSAQPAKPRNTLGVWRQKPAAAPPISPPPQADQQPAAVELQNVFEELAALEAQLVHPVQQPAPVVAPVEPAPELPPLPVAPRHEPPTPPAEPLHQPAIPEAEATIPRQPPQAAAVPQDPLFDFTVPLPAEQAANPFTPAATGLTRSRKRYLLWGACVVSGLLLIQGGRWFYQERNDAASLALIANQATAKPQAAATVQRAIAAQDVAPASATRPNVTPAIPEPRPVSALPPLVMLEPEAPTVTRPEPAPPPVTRPVERQAAPKPAPVAKQAPAASLPKPKPPVRTARKQPEAPAKPATEKAKREPVRQLARAAAVETKKPARREATMTATLEACRAHGYSAAQCVKRACEVTQYGFVCRGR